MGLNAELQRRWPSAYWTARNGQTILRRPAEARALWRTIDERRRPGVAPTPPSPRPRVLVYHAVDQPEFFVNNIASRRFRRQLQLALDEGYRFGSLDDVAAAEPDDALLSISFDDGYRSAGSFAPTLAEFGAPWTMFVTSTWSDGDAWRPELFLDWTELEDLLDSGVHIGSHSATHPDFGSLEESAARVELETSRETIRQRLGVEVTDFAIPFGNAANWSDQAHRAALDVGYTRIYAQSEELRFPGTVGRSFVSGFDSDRTFVATLRGAFDRWEEPAA